MADSHRIVRQWLETDAAFGVADVPLRPASAAAPAAPSEPQRALAPAAPAPRAAPAVAPSPAHRPPPAQPSLIASDPRSGDAAMAKRKVAVPLPAAPAGNIADLPPTTRGQKEKALAALLAEVEAASKSYLNDVSTRVVFGEGDPDADILFVGEGPGVEEDRTGRPFVGKSGQLLDKMITAIGYKRDGANSVGVYIANVVKLRAADWSADGSKLTDRPPTPEEVARGIPYLHRQIEIIRPRVIVTLGAPAVKYVTGTTEGVMKIRGTWLSYRGIPVMPTYHPAFVLRAYTEENRRKVWSDLKAAKARVAE